jgi:preprotein translocase subunit SecY
VSTGELSPLFAILLIAIIIGVTGSACSSSAPAPHRRALCQAPGRRRIRGAEQPSAVQAQYVGCHSADFCLEPAVVSATIASFFGTGNESAFGYWLQSMSAALGYGQPLHLVLYALLILLAVLLHRAGVQRARPPITSRRVARSSRASAPASRPPNTSTRC